MSLLAYLDKIRARSSSSVQNKSPVTLSSSRDKGKAKRSVVYSSSSSNNSSVTDADRERSLIERHNNKLNTTIRKQRVKIAGTKGEIVKQLKRARENVRVPVENLDDDDDDGDGGVARLASVQEELKKAKHDEDQANDELSEIQMRVISAQQQARPIKIELRPLNSCSLQDYFRRAKDTGHVASAQEGSGHPFNGINDIGSQLQQIRAKTPGAPTFTEDPVAKAARVEASVKQSQLHTTVLQMQARSWYEGTLAAANRSNNMRMFAQKLVEVLALLLSDIEQQMNVPFDMLPVCDWGVQCAAVTQLAPLLDGSRAPLKAWQCPSDYKTFLTNGMIMSSVRGYRNQLCAVCLMAAFSELFMTNKQSNKPCGDIIPPFVFVVERPGGMQRARAICDQTMPGPFMLFVASYFVPCSRVIKRAIVDSLTQERHVVETRVYGYEFASHVRYTIPDVVQNNGGLTQVAPLDGISMGDLEITLYDALRTDIVCQPQYVALASTPEQPLYAHMKKRLKLLCCTFAETLQQVLGTGDDTPERWEMMEACADLFVSALAMFGSDQMRIMGGAEASKARLSTHSISLSLLWRIGFSDVLRSQLVMGDCENCTSYCDIHIKLLEMVHQRWIDVKHLPSDEELGNSDLSTPASYDVLEAWLRKNDVYPDAGGGNVLPILNPQEVYKVTHSAKVHHKERHSKPLRQVAASMLKHCDKHLLNAVTCLTTLDVMSELNRCIFGDLKEWTLTNAKHQALLSRIFASTTQKPLATVLLVAALLPSIEDTAQLLQWVVTQWWPNLTIENEIYTLCSKFPVFNPFQLHATRTPLYKHTVAVAVLLRVHVLARELEYVQRRVHASAPINSVESNCSGDSFLFLTPESMRSNSLRASLKDAHSFLRMQRGQKVSATLATSLLYNDDNDYKKWHPLEEVVKALHAGDKAKQTAVLNKMESDGTDWLFTNYADALFEKEKQAKPPVAIGVVGERGRTPDTELAYQLKCALFSHLSTAVTLQKRHSAGKRVPHDTEVSRLLLSGVLDDSGYLTCADGVVPCEETMADFAGYLPLLDILKKDNVVEQFHEEVRSSWLEKVCSAIQLVCYIRDFRQKHQRNCQTPQYLRWSVQALFITLLGTYRHALDVPSFATAMHIFVALSDEQVSRELVLRNDCVVLKALRENLMVQLQNSAAYCAVVHKVWPRFRYVQQIKVPRGADALRRMLEARMSCQGGGLIGNALSWCERCNIELDDAEEDSSCYDANDDDDDDNTTGVPSSQRPVVFRHLPRSFHDEMLDEFKEHEISYWTDSLMSEHDERGAMNQSLPPIFEIVPLAVMRYVMDRVSELGQGKPMSLRVLRSVGVSDSACMMVYCANMMFIHKRRCLDLRRWINALQRPDYFLVWLCLHIYRQHCTTALCQLPLNIAQRQYRAVVRRSSVQYGSEPPMNYFTIAMCHLLGCARPMQLFVPQVDDFHYGMDDVAFCSDLNAMVCTLRKDHNVLNPVARRLRDSNLRQVQENYNNMVAVVRTSEDAELALQADIEASALRRSLDISERKMVRSLVSVVHQLPCTAAPIREFSAMGSVLHCVCLGRMRNPTKSLTLCPRCGVHTLYSMDRYGQNGLSCGLCDRAERMLEYGCYCVGCEQLVPTADIPTLSGDSEHLIQNTGSTRSCGGGKRALNKPQKKQARDEDTDDASSSAASTTDLIDDQMQPKVRRRGRKPGSKNSTPRKRGKQSQQDQHSTDDDGDNDSSASETDSKNTGTRRRKNDPHVSMNLFMFYDDRAVVGLRKWTRCRLCAICQRKLPAASKILTLSQVLYYTKSAAGNNSRAIREAAIEELDDASLAIVNYLTTENRWKNIPAF